MEIPPRNRMNEWLIHGWGNNTMIMKNVGYFIRFEAFIAAEDSEVFLGSQPCTDSEVFLGSQPCTYILSNYTLT
jgi:hypothetical protein